ncbi:MAG: helix-turn-helix transcriptional regulator [bacterium]|nr:helix-turn-helix transcriptional regulator [bacterium]
MTLGEKLTKLRQEKGIYKAALAEAIGIAPSHIGRYEKDASVPTAFVLKRIAEFYNVSMDYIMSDDDAESPNVLITDKELLQLFEEVSKIDDEEKYHVKYFIKLVLNNYKIKEMAGVSSK